ncbi:hypothetical protein HMPREF1982_00264 [Clostridiales bacterium oral taxon 876 str. F0540]|nr:hypothetical protein HMPREF1982_00264 [Clostridiales bacterium oral taxon 876 str. F0540]
MKNRVLMITTTIFLFISTVIIYKNTNINEKVTDNSSSHARVINDNNNEVELQESFSKNKENIERYFFAIKGDRDIIILNGIQGKFGFTEPICYENNLVYTTLYLWSNKGDILSKNLKIIAVNANEENIEISNVYKVTKDGHEEYTEKNTVSTAKEQLNIQLPSDGLWKFQIYLNGELFGDTIINIKHKDNNSIIPSPL